jgi:hypothetical protein
MLDSRSMQLLSVYGTGAIKLNCNFHHGKAKMDLPNKIFIELGLRLSSESKLEFFGIDDVNAAVVAGYKLITVEKAGH